jgi:hypothetical protein
MAYIRTRDDDDPYYLSPEEEKQMEADAEFERLHAENARQASVIADLHSALTDIAEICGDYGDGAPDDHSSFSPRTRISVANTRISQAFAMRPSPTSQSMA